jgi:NADPH:quinone reductase-like Zn-dependent oxidoreductase
MAGTAPKSHHPTDGPGTSGGRMLAIFQDRYGSADVLRLAEVAQPQVGAGDALVQVRAAGLDRGTWHLMTGIPYAVRLGFGLRAPKVPVPGRDVAGVVVAVGAGVTRFAPGDEVFGVGRGSFAERCAAPEDKLAPKPPSLSFEQAAAVPISGLTALRAVEDVARVEAGQHVLIVGASGGVGTYAVQIAKALGATVTGVASTAKVDLVRSIGADHVLDYTREDFAAGPQRYDVILDIGGNAALRRLRRALTDRGTLVLTGGEAGDRLTGGAGRQLQALARSRFGDQRMTTFLNREHHTGLERLTALVERGEVVPVIERTYPLAEVPTAMRHLEAGRARGKLVITV